MESEENFKDENEKEKSSVNPLGQAYFLIYNKEPEKMEDWEIAQNIVEVLDDSQWVSSDLAKECIYRIVHLLSYPNDETKKKIILMAEEKSKGVFPELSNIDEVHMDQIEYAYNEWKEKNKNQLDNL